MEINGKNTVLLVEDDENDALFFEYACQAVNVSFEHRIVASGGLAIAYLGGVGKYANRALFPLPNLIVLDIKLPDMSGFDVLRWIRLDPALKYVPVIMFTSSSLQADVIKAYDERANAYMVKPMDAKTFGDIVTALENFWFRTPTAQPW
jgi:CheY-like chemotaxis protein